MKLTQERISRYLKKLKHVNDYLLKLESSDRDIKMRIMRACGELLEGESTLRKLNEYLVTGDK